MKGKKPDSKLEGDKKIKALVPSEVPLYRYEHPYGSVCIYVPSGQPMTPEKLLFLLEKAKFDLFYRNALQ